MANALGSVTVDVQLFGRTVLKFLKSRLVLVGKVSRNYEGAAASPGDEIEIPWITIAGDAADRAIGSPATASDMSSHKVKVKVGQIYKAVTVDNLEDLFSSVNLMEQAAQQLAYKVAKAADKKMFNAFNEQVGYEAGPVDGTTIFPASGDPLQYINASYEILEKNEADLDGLQLVLGTKEAFNYRSKDQLRKANESGDTSLLRNANLGRVLGFDVSSSQALGNATYATAAQTASPGAVSGAQVMGATAIAISGLGLSQTVPKGTTFSIAGVTNGTGALVRFSVTADATSDGAGLAAVVNIHPALPQALAGSEVVTFTEHSAASSVNLAFHRDAALFVARPSKGFIPGAGVVSEIVTDEQTGLSIRIAIQSTLLDATAGYKTAIAADLVAGGKVIRPDFAVKLTGAPN